jgi:nicotinamide mononucleotide transporter
VSPLELTAVAFGLVSVFLSAKEKIWSWPTGIVNVGLFAILFWEQKLYADAGLQVIYLLLSIYGWYEWLYGGEHRTELRVSRLTGRLAAILAAIGALGSVALGTLLHRTTDAALPYLDSTLSVFSLVAQYLMTRKIVENWALWVALDVVYVGVFIWLKPLYPTAVQYAVFLVIAAMGYVEWRRSWRERQRAHAPSAAAA